jgi:hypothetical protein
MYSLANETLAVAVLDPVADQDRFGTRYCTGGYIFQVTDARLGDLLCGPTFPESYNRFDGQGLPEAFSHNPLHEAREAQGMIIGVGRCDLARNEVEEFCQWEVVQQPDALLLRTEHGYQGYAVELERTVQLRGRTVRSATRLQNTGKRLIPVRWYPHPFYPQPEGAELCRFNLPVRFPDNPGYEVGGSGWIRRRNWPWDQRGHFQPLEHEAGTGLIVYQRHPKLGLVAATCSYVPAFFPIWGNGRTFSWEPYLERSLTPGQEASWWIDYEF